jgi:hypothetical protein
MKINSPLVRIGVAGISSCVIVFGIIVMVIRPIDAHVQGWIGMVFGPIAIVVGSLFLFVAMLVPTRLTGNTRKSKHRD